MYEQPTTVETITPADNEVWETIPEFEIQFVVRTIAERVRAIIGARGTYVQLAQYLSFLSFSWFPGNSSGHVSFLVQEMTSNLFISGYPRHYQNT